MDRTTPLRRSPRFTENRALLHQILDDAHVAHVGLVVPSPETVVPSPETGEGEPRVLPMFHVRVGERVYVHGSTGGRFGLATRGTDLRLCLVVTLLDGLVLAKSQFNHTTNYRSVVVHGIARVVTDPDERDQALTAFADKVAQGRSADSRPPNNKELAQTVLLALDLDEVTVKTRSGGPVDDAEDADLPHWSGVIPLTTVAGRPQAAGTEPLPGYLAGSPWLHPAPMVGRKVRLEPLRAEHVPELLETCSDPEVWEWLPAARPTSEEEMSTMVNGALSDPNRVAWVQVDTSHGRVIGTTSFYEVDPQNRAVTIGYTWLGKPWWRTGINSEAKLLLLSRAFDELGALRVTWHTDGSNHRSRAAIERLGAKLEGVIRHHRIRPDGTLRDTYWYGMTADEWPAARARLGAE